MWIPTFHDPIKTWMDSSMPIKHFENWNWKLNKTDREKGSCSDFSIIAKNICALLLCLCFSVRQTTADMMTSGGWPLTPGEISHRRCQAKANEEKLNSGWSFRSIFNKLWLMTVSFSSSITDQVSPAGAEKQLNQTNLFWIVPGIYLQA